MSARDEPPHRRPRSRSPVRRAERYDRDEVPRGEPPRRDRDYDRDRGGRDHRDRDPYARVDRDYRGDRGERGGRGGNSGRYDERDRGGRRDDRDDYRGGRGGHYDDRDRFEDRGGRGGGREKEWDRDRPLDRRAIEEGRRRREAERARGVVFTADGQKIEPKGECRGDKDLMAVEEPEEEAPPEDEDVDDETRAMQAMMGFGGFGTTKVSHRRGRADSRAPRLKETMWGHPRSTRSVLGAST